MNVFCGKLSIMFRLTSALVLVAASFAAAELHIGSEVITGQMYAKEFFKLVGEEHAHLKDVDSEVVPEQIKLRLYSSPEEVYEETLKNYVNLLRHPQFNKTLETKIYVHGWLEKEDQRLHKMLSALYAYRGKRVNWITVDWSEYSHHTGFSHIQKQVVPKIAEHLVPLIEKLMEMQNNNKIHVIGFGVGAHLAGLTGKHIHGRKVVRITGISPTGLFYDNVTETERLAKDDAEYVDIIHTTMGNIGISKPIGNVDFFPNGGRQQPAAETHADYTHIQKAIVSHMVAKNYYVESVELGCGGFIGKKCDSWANFLNQKCATHETEVMGETLSHRVNGTVYLSVNKEMKPFYSKGIYGIYPYVSSTYHSYSTTSKYHA